MKSTIFLSYSSEQSEAAARIELSLKGDGHTVFRDRSSLPPGESFDARIRGFPFNSPAGIKSPRRCSFSSSLGESAGSAFTNNKITRILNDANAAIKRLAS